MNSKPDKPSTEMEIWLGAQRMDLLSGLASGIAHAINNPLSGILQSAQLIGRGINLDHPRVEGLLDKLEIDGETREKFKDFIKERGMKRFVEMILGCARDASEMTARFFRFAQAQEARPEAVALEAVLDWALSLARQDLELRECCNFHEMDIDIQTDENTGKAWIDQPNAVHVLIKLIKFAAVNLKEAEGHKLGFHIRQDGESVSLLLSENGPPIAENIRAGLFESPKNPTDQDVSPGALADCAFIVNEILDGEILLESDEGGNSYILSFPAAVGEEG